MNILLELLPSGFEQNWMSALMWGTVWLCIAYVVSRLVGSLVERRAGESSGRICRRLTWYLLVFIAVLSTVTQLGFDISILLGTAGVLTIALGFAAQTSAANVVSGLFLLGERPFEQGDTIKIGDTIGTVAQIDLLSVRLCTFDNLMVRFPNEMILKSPITNLSHYPLRRIDIPLRIAYEESSEDVQALLLDVARNHHEILDEPDPVFMFTDFGPSGQQVTFGVWAPSTEFVRLRNEMRATIKKTFDRSGVRFAYDQLIIRSDSAAYGSTSGGDTP